MSLNRIISSLSADDYTGFLQYLSKKNRRSDVKNIELFKLLYADELSSEEICKALYGNARKDAYHALRKRLYDSLIDFLASANLEDENSEKVQIIKYTLVAHSFLQQEQYALALKLLEKAETIAKEYQLYTYLNEIYHTKIQFSYAFTTLDLETQIATFKENQRLYFLEEELNIVYAKVREQLLLLHYKGEAINFQELFIGILAKQQITIDETLSFKSLYQLLTIASISAFVTKDYLEIESFMMETYSLLEKRTNREKQRFYHIQSLYMIANMFFRNKQFEKSQHFLALMHQEMLGNRKKYYKRFLLKYELLLNLNLNYTNRQDEAIARTLPLLKKKHQDIETLLEIHLSLVVFYAQKNEFKKAYQFLSKLYHTDHWYAEKVGKEWVIKKSLVEILLLVELDKFDLFENRLSRFKRQFSAYLKDIHQEKTLLFLKYVEHYYNNPKEVTSKEFFNKIENSFEWIGAKREDIFVMSFYAWLKSKMLQESIYNVTLDLIQQAREL